MWRLNWIHPFEAGNGRTSRASSYIVLCLRIGQRLPGTKTISEVISEDKRLYYAAIDKADSAAEKGKVDVTAMEVVLKDALTVQLASFADAVTDGYLTGGVKPENQQMEQPPVRWTTRLHEHYNGNQFWYWCTGALLAVGSILISFI